MPAIVNNADTPNRWFYMSAYAIAVKHGYKGTEEAFVNEMMNGARNAAEDARESAQAAENSAGAAADSATDAETAKTAAEDSATAAAASEAAAKDYADHIADPVEGYVAEVTREWIAENLMQETGYVIDQSLSVPNAAADASRVGEIKKAINSTLVPASWSIDADVTHYLSSEAGKKSYSLKYACAYLFPGYGSTVAVKLDSNVYEYWLSYYTAEGDVSTPDGYVGWSGIIGAGIQYIPESAILFGISFRRVDRANLDAQTDVAAFNAALSVYRNTDTELQTKGFPADAKKTGEIKSDLYSFIEGMDSEIIDWAVLYRWGSATLGWYTGYYSPETGAAINSQKYIRTANFKRDFSDAICFVIEPPEGYFVVASEYTQEKVFVKNTSTSEKKIIFTNGHRFNFYVGRFDNSDAADHITEEFINSITITVVYGATQGGQKKARTGDYEWFSVLVDRPLAFGDEEQRTTEENVECVLRLPKSYQRAGKPTQLILACHGAHGYINSSTNTWYNSNWKSFMDELLAAGYAVFDANIFPISTGTEQMGYAWGSPLYINVLKKAYDYITENYNVTPKILVHGTSMGGIGATAFCHAFPQLVLAESSFAGRDILFCLAAINNATEQTAIDLDRFALSWGYADFNALTDDKFSHVEGTFPGLSLVKIENDGTVHLPPDRETDYQNWLAFYAGLYNRGRYDNVGSWIGHRAVPYKAWNSWADNIRSSKLEETMQKAYNTGNSCPYYAVSYESGTHTEISYGKINDMIPQLIEWYKRFDLFFYAEDEDE